MDDDRFDERLTLTSPPPPDLLERVRARRAAGERVLLPSVPAAPPRSALRPPSRAPRRSWRWAAAPAGIAAAAIVAVVGQRRTDSAAGRSVSPADPPAAAARTDGGAPPRTGPASPEGAGPDLSASRPSPSRSPASPTPPAAAARPVAPGSARPAATEPARERVRSAPLAPAAQDPGEARSAHAAGGAGGAASAPAAARFTLRALAGGLALALPDGPGAPDAAQRPMLDSLARLLARDPARRLVVRYADPAFTRESASWRLASRVSDYLVARGVAPERVTFARVPTVAGGGAGAEAVEVVVGSR